MSNSEKGKIAFQNGNNNYYGQNGYEKNIAKAIEWYQIAAKEGVPAAQSYMGYFYKTGEGVPYNIVTAIEWYRLAAQNGYIDAQWALYNIFAQGDGVAVNMEEAQKYLIMAANCGDHTARFNLAVQNYNNGNCSKEVLLQIIAIMEELDRENFVNASYWLGIKYYYGIHFSDLINQQKGISYLQHAKELGHPDAACILGVAYINGNEVEKDIHKGVEYLYFAYDYGNDTTSVLSDLGKCYIEGLGVEQDIELGTCLLKRYIRILPPDDKRITLTQQYLEAIKQKYGYDSFNGALPANGAEIMNRLNMNIQSNNTGSWEEFYSWLKKIQGSTEKYAALGYLYSESGCLTMKDIHLSYESFRKSICYNMQNAFSQKWLGWYYENGIATNKDLNRAYDSYALSNQLSPNDWVQSRLEALSR